MSKVTVYSARTVFPITGPAIKDGAVAVLQDRILHVGDRAWVLQQLQDRGLRFTEERWEGALTPGLVNAHTHLQYTCMAEVAEKQYSGFKQWGDAFDLVYHREQHDWQAAAQTGTQLSLRAGVTAAADVVTDREALTALHDAGMHGVTFWEIYGKTNSDWGAAQLADVRAQVHAIPTPPAAGVSPHAPYSLGVEPLLDLPDIAREAGLRLHIHLAEDADEGGLLGGVSDWASTGSDSFTDLRQRGIGVSSTKFVDQLGVLGPDCHIAHGVYVDADDRALLRARGTAVALCPRSNSVIGLDEPPVAAYLSEGNHIAVGTDSLSSSPSLDPLADVALLYDIARRQGYAAPDLHERLFTALTLGGATALGQQVGEKRIGQLVAGASADLAFFETASADPKEVLAELVEAGAGLNRRTIIDGREKFCAPL
ncbi:amidohydrolase family protein [Canibacter zhoujuaniae]|uniref:amidohydrolase family protein n=1 Tax=Canibacter zhoujuaniae TaxID=2708343 RepID=UPI0014234B5C|nr:amidohydrolase family protein [Canibacter zhoujuaniae]